MLAQSGDVAGVGKLSYRFGVAFFKMLVQDFGQAAGAVAIADGGGEQHEVGGVTGQRHDLGHHYPQFQNIEAGADDRTVALVGNFPQFPPTGACFLATAVDPEIGPNSAGKPGVRRGCQKAPPAT